MGTQAPTSARAPFRIRFPTPHPEKNTARSSCDQYARSAASDLAESVPMPGMPKRAENKKYNHIRSSIMAKHLFSIRQHIDKRFVLLKRLSPIVGKAFSDMWIDAGFERILCSESLSAESLSGWHCPFITDKQPL